MAPKVSYGQKGAIVSIRLRNFMTYTDCTLRPAGNLNMIIGPNGSGKSAIVCAIIVGLAGEVSLTGRATNIISLVKKGCDSASTKIELWSGKQTVRNDIIERKITVQRSGDKIGCKNEWKHNGCPVQVKYIQDLMQKLNIKVDNLCQFLPQDSVASFVKMSPSELLVNTLEAAGDGQLVKDLNELQRYTKDISEQTKQLEELKKSSEENVVNARRLESEVERLREREKLAQERITCAKKMEYCKYLEAKEALSSAEEELRDKKELLKEVKKRGDPHKKEIDSNRSEAVKLTESVRKLNLYRSQVVDKMQSQFEKIGGRDAEIQDHYSRFKTKEREERERGQRIRERQRELEGYECRLSDMRDVDYTRDIEKMRALTESKKRELMDKKNEAGRIEDQLRNLVRETDQAKADRERILGVKDKKLNLLNSKQPDAHKVVEWLVKNQDKFKKKVYWPMFCEINVKDARDSAIIEHAIPSADLYAFVCEDESDLKLLTHVARQDLRANINVILRPDKTIEEFQEEANRPRLPRAEFKYLMDLIDAPEPIMRYLYGLHHFHMIPAFKELTEQDLKIVMERCRRFYVGSKSYQITKSRYDNETMTVTDSVRLAQLLIHSLDNNQLRKCTQNLESCLRRRQEYEQERTKIHNEYDEITKEWNEFVKKVNDLTVRQNEKSRLETLISRCQSDIREWQTEKIDVEGARQKLREAVKNVNRNIANDLRQALSSVTKIDQSIEPELSTQVLLLRLALKNVKVYEQQYKDAISQTSQLEREILVLGNNIGHFKSNLRDADRNARDKIKGFNNGILDKDTKRSFAAIAQNTVNDLETYLEELKARIHGICRDPNNQLLNDYNRQHAELRDKQRQMTELTTSLEMSKASRLEIKENFLPKLGGLIKVIDEHYRDFMRKLNYDGKVELKRNEEDLDDFSDYGVNILVKYRDNEQLIALSSTRQSGGERSVATMIYMLALQTQTTVPFRVVDEINQGMDQDNERKVFELLVRTADESSSQYFLVSPKLLSGLNYGEKMQIHAVFNGPALNFSFDDLMGYQESGSQGRAVEV